MCDTGFNTAAIMDAIFAVLEIFIPVTLIKRILAAVLILAHVDNATITKLTGYCDRSVRTMIKRMKAGEISELFVVRGGGRKAKVADIEEEILKELETNNYFSTQQIKDMIQDKFQIDMSLEAVRGFLKKHGYKKMKSASLPAKADPNEQRNFYNEKMVPLLEKAEAGKIKVFFMDAAHFVLGCNFLGCIYCRKRRFVKTFSGRQRYNVLGAIDYVTKEVLTVTNDTYITATQICEMLEKISKMYPDQEIHIFLDNARYQKCELVKSLADKLNINLDYIPSYSPNLNLIERLWRYVKGELRTRYYDNFSVFKQRIDAIIASTTGENQYRIKTLIGKKVQLYDDMVQIRPDTFQKTTQKKAV